MIMPSNSPAQAAITALIRDGKLAYKEDISEGIKDAPMNMSLPVPISGGG